MEESSLLKIQGWFEHLDRKIETLNQNLDRKIETLGQDMVTKQQFENRFNALMTSMMNLHERVETYKEQTDTEIQIIKRALRDLDEEVKQIRERLH